MKRRLLVCLMFLALVGVVSATCARPTFPETPARWELEWHETNPPRPGLRCWMAAYPSHDGRTTRLNYGFDVYCEPAGP